MARLCQVCVTQESKYKCPSCRAPYCSAGCYKTHKETPCEGGADATTGSSTATISALNAGVVAVETAAVRNSSKPQTNDEANDNIDPTKLLTAEQLAGLRQSAATKEHLANPHIRELLTQIDSSANRMKALEKALLNPVFSNFMFRALDEIESNA